MTTTNHDRNRPKNCSHIIIPNTYDPPEIQSDSKSFQKISYLNKYGIDDYHLNMHTIKYVYHF